MTIKLETVVVLKVPMVPNFIQGISHEQPNGVKEHNFSVGDLTNEQLRELAAKWTTDLLNRAEEIRTRKAEEIHVNQ